MVYFNNLWHKFEEIDSDHDHRIDAEEFAAGCEVVGLRLSPEEAAAEFAKCDADGGGQILFSEFCKWCAERHIGDNDSAEEAEEEGRRLLRFAAHGAIEFECGEIGHGSTTDPCLVFTMYMYMT